MKGGKGNDVFVSQYGTETYHFDLGDGQDIISASYMYNNRIGDKIIFGEGVKKEDILAKKSGNHLILENTTSGDTITIEEAYKYRDGSYQIKDILFADGSALTADEIAAMVQTQEVHGTENNDTIKDLSDWYAYHNDATIHGYEGNDTIYGYNGNDTIYGDEGADTLYGGDGDDTLFGGEGNDTLYGDYGNDTYLFNQGDGQDNISDNYGNNTIAFGEGIDRNSLIISTDSNNVSINFSDSEDMLTLIDGLRNDAYKNFELTFIDGSIGAIDLSGETESMIQILKEADILTETQNDIAAGETVSDETLADTQVLQIVDVMNTGSNETISTVENTATTNTVDETLLFVES